MDVETTNASGGNTAGGEADNGEITEEQATAQSLRCDDCGKLLRDGIVSLSFRNSKINRNG
jgi:hypothetical protein